MAVSTLNFYTTEITPERNCKIDNITTYLSDCNHMIIGNFQYSKIKLDDTIKINWNQNELPNFPFNYLSITKSDDINAKVYYYFILNSNWKSENTVELQISLDTINTFWSNLIWTDRTNITRQHKDRFYKPTTVATGAITLNRDVDDYDEGITPVKTLVSQVKMTSAQSNYDWYLIYKNKADITENTTVPIDCFCCASQEINVNIPAGQNGIDLSSYSEHDSIYILALSNNPVTFTLKGETYTISQDGEYKALEIVIRSGVGFAYIVKDSGTVNISGITGTILVDLPGSVMCQYVSNWNYTPTGYSELIGDLVQQNPTSFTIGTSESKIRSIDTINRTDTRIVKIIKMPYAPFDATMLSGKLVVPDGWSFANGYLKLNNLNEEFISTCATLSTARDLQVTIPAGDRTTVTNDKTYESKLKNSNFYSWKFYYDNFNKEIMMERTVLDADSSELPKLRVQFKQSNNLSSNSLFYFTEEGNLTYNEPNLYGEYLNVNRQNEVALYSSDYLNYIRSGYNYDKKAKTLQAASGWLGTGLNAIGAVGSLASRAKTGALGLSGLISFGTSTIQTLSSTIFNTIAAENALQQKLESLRLSPASVSNTEDLNLLSFYNGNRLISVKEKCTDEIENQIYNLFRLTGYSCNEYAIPDFNSRTWFNFIQCDADFDESKWKYGQDFLNDLKSKLAIGVTIFHRVNDYYDFNQELENFESWLTNNG